MFGRDSPANACFDMLLVTMFYGLISWLSRKYWICHPYMSNFLKSGIGSCIAPKAGLARHPAKGKFDAVNAIRILRFWCSIQLGGASDQGAAGVTLLFRRQAKKARVQATCSILLNAQPLNFLDFYLSFFNSALFSTRARKHPPPELKHVPKIH